MERVHIPRAAEGAISSHEGHRFFKAAHPEDASSWAIMDDKVYMHCVGVYGFSLLTNHSIEPNGEVNASVLSTDGVGGEYHEHVILDGWDSNLKKLAGSETPQPI